MLAAFLHRVHGMNATTTTIDTARDLEGVKRLLAAVLDDAIAVVKRDGGRRDRRQLVRETREWFASDDTGSPFDFLNVCAVLGIDALAMREAIRHYDHAPLAA